MVKFKQLSFEENNNYMNFPEEGITIKSKEFDFLNNYFNKNFKTIEQEIKTHLKNIFKEHLPYKDTEEAEEDMSNIFWTKVVINSWCPQCLNQIHYEQRANRLDIEEGCNYLSNKLSYLFFYTGKQLNINSEIVFCY